MVIKQTTQIGSPVIRKKSRSVLRIHAKATKRIIRNLIDSMRHHGLVGMAAPQIGINRRIFVTEIRKTKTRKPDELDSVRVFINPKIVSRSRKQVGGYEGCGSVANAGLFGSVKRPYVVVVKALNEKGRKFKLRATDLLARIIQHENDHLDVFLLAWHEYRTLTKRKK